MIRIAFLTGWIELGIILYLIGASINAVQTFQAFTPGRLFSAWTLNWIGGTVMIGPQVIYFREPGINSKSSEKKTPTGSKDTTKEKNTSQTIEQTQSMLDLNVENTELSSNF